MQDFKKLATMLIITSTLVILNVTEITSEKSITLDANLRIRGLQLDLHLSRYLDLAIDSGE